MIKRETLYSNLGNNTKMFFSLLLVQVTLSTTRSCQVSSWEGSWFLWEWVVHTYKTCDCLYQSWSSKLPGSIWPFTDYQTEFIPWLFLTFPDFTWNWLDTQNKEQGQCFWSCKSCHSYAQFSLSLTDGIYLEVQPIKFLLLFKYLHFLLNHRRRPSTATSNPQPQPQPPTIPTIPKEPTSDWF